MNVIDIASIIVLIIIALGGYAMGFGKSLKAITGGPMGFIISFFVCVAFGGTLQNISLIAKFIAHINTITTDFWSFLSYLKLGHVAFYVILFVVVQIARAIVVNTIAKIDYNQNKVIMYINNFLGGALCLAFFSGIVLLAFAVMSLLDDTSFIQNILNKISNSYLFVIYQNNPISFN